MEDLDASIRARLEPALGANASTVVMQQSIGQIVYAGKTRQVVITLQDGSRIEYSLLATSTKASDAASYTRPARKAVG